MFRMLDNNPNFMPNEEIADVANNRSSGTSIRTSKEKDFVHDHIASQIWSS